MTAPASIDADRVHALNRLIREKTGRVDTETATEASQRKNLWLQIPAADPRSRRRRAGRHRTAGSRNAATDTSPVTLATRIRRALTLLLGAALLLATAATAVELLTAQGRDPLRTTDEAASAAAKHAAPAPGRPPQTPAPSGAFDAQVGALQQENQRLRERLQSLERALASEASPQAQ